MIRLLGQLMLVAALPAAGDVPPPDPAAPGASDPFARYQSIMDRKPFGEVAAAGAADPGKSEASESAIAASLKLVALERDEESGKVRAGVVDEAAHKNYYLTIGDEEDEIKLMDADFKGDRALIRKSGQEVWLTLGSGKGSSSSAPSAAAVGPSPAPTEVARRQRFRELMDARNRARETAAQNPTNAPAAAPPVVRPQFKNNEEMKAYYRKINMDLIRAGGKKGPPLPIPLTPEEDAQLVKEGVLPPPAEAPAPAPNP